MLTPVSMSAAPARYMNERVIVVSDEVDTNGTRRSREGARVQRELPDGRNFRKLALPDNAGVHTTEPDTEDGTRTRAVEGTGACLAHLVE
jgi:hypothetical protein